MKTLLILAVLASSVACITGKLSNEDAMGHCRDRSGLKSADIQSYQVKNGECALDCITVGGVLTHFVRDGEPCGEESGYKCILGKCRFPSEKVQLEKPLYKLSIQIKSANVPDKDPVPTTGASDTFIATEVTGDTKPVFQDGQIICYTHVVQDNLRPKWSNFICRPPPMSGEAMLKFSAFDSDQPTANPDYMGSATRNVESLVGMGPVKLPLLVGDEGYSEYYVEVDVKGEKIENFDNL